MNPINILFVVIFILIGIGRAVAYAIKNAPKNKHRPTHDADYVAPQNTVMDFLRNLQQPAQTGESDLVVLSDEESAHDDECHDPLPSERRAASQRPAPVRVAPARLAPAGKTAQPRRRRKKSAKAPPRSRRISTAAPETTPSKARRPALRSADLRQAVIWSEILGPPVCMRGRGGRGGYGDKQQ